MEGANFDSKSFEITETSEATNIDVISRKTISDPVHGHMSIHPLCMAIIDTRQFQRLRFIKQVGLLHYVYPGATHTLFSHSVGVCYLAGRFIRNLRNCQPSLNITETDILCVEIAGLCHDLGHGPFSHTWEKFMEKKNTTGQHNWKREMVSVNMFEYLIQDNSLREVFKKWGIEEDELATIKDIILRNKPPAPEKYFLYQIINNKESGIDVDKWDYYLRDSYHLGLPFGFDIDRILLLARVISVEGNLQVCFRDKQIYNILEMFRIRSELHRVAYQHGFVNLMHNLLLEMLMEIDGKTLAPDGDPYHLWEWSYSAGLDQSQKTWEDFSCRMDHFNQLTDNFILGILEEGTERTTGSMSVQERFALFHNRPALKKAFCFVGEAQVHTGDINENEVCSQIISFLPEVKASSEEYSQSVLQCKDILLQVVNIHWGKGKYNPLSDVYCYSKDQPNVAQCLLSNDKYQVVFPETFEQKRIIVHSRYLRDRELEILRKCFELYYKTFHTEFENLAQNELK